MLEYIRRILALKKKADSKLATVEQGIGAYDHAVIAYERGASLPGILRVFAGVTESKADDKADDAVLALLGELKQTIFNASEILKANAAMLNGVASQLDGLRDVFQEAEKSSLKKVLEGDDEL